MADEMTVRALLEQGVHFTVETGSGHAIALDAAVKSGGEDAGARPMELLLAALASCSGIGVIGILRKMRQDVTTYEICVRGERAATIPYVYTAIFVEHNFVGHNLQETAIQRAIMLDTEHYCGVHRMLSQVTRIEHTFSIQNKIL